MTFQDRTGTNLNRKKIKIISQTPSEIIADIERADNPITEGTKINAAVFNTFQDNINTALANSSSANQNAATALTKATEAQNTSTLVANQFNELITASEFLSLNYSSTPATWAHTEVNTLPTMFGVLANENSNVKFYGEGNIKANIVVDGDIYGADGQKKVAYQNDLLDLIYPIGAIYMSVTGVSPAQTLGGCWEHIEDKFLLASGSNFTLGSEGGEVNVTLTEETLPAHWHQQTINDSPIISWSPAYSNGGQTGGWSVTEKEYGTNYKQNTKNTGGNQPHNNMPPYVVVNVWKRVQPEGGI